MLARLAAAEPTVLLVRHAEKAEGGSDPKDPALSDVGQTRVEHLRDMLRDAGITAIYATEFTRTQLTAQPIAAATNIPVTIVPAKDTAALVAQLKELRGTALVVGHSNTLPEIIKALGIERPVTISEADYDNIFAFIPGSPPQFMQLHFR